MSTVTTTGVNEHLVRDAPSATGLRVAVGVASGVGTIALAVLSVGWSGTTTVSRSLHVVAAAVLVAWALAGVSALVRGPVQLGWLVSAGALVGAVAAEAAHLAAVHGTLTHSTAKSIATIAASLAMAVSVHALVALPDGVLGRTSRKAGVAVWYAAALAVAVSAASSSHELMRTSLAVAWGVAVATALPAVYYRYVASTGTSRVRLQWLGVGAVISLEVALVAGALSLLVHWPSQVLAFAVGGTVFMPIALLAATLSPPTRRADRVFVGALFVLGFSAFAAATYLVVVLGLGTTPSSSADREVLGLSMAAAAIVAIGFLPVRERISRSATGFVYGAREAPDEVVRTFGTRLTRAIPMDELLLQLAESLRKTLTLASAEIYTGTGEILELAVSVPDVGERTIVVSSRERPVITAAGVSGNAWASVWLPSLVAGRSGGQLRVAPISHAGELLGVIVVARELGANAFTEEDDRVLTELARQVGLAFHNAQLDTALQTSLDELRRQADELRASRARIVASGDAERRKVERNLHDGAQQHLVALAVNLRLAKDVVKEDPDAAVAMLGELGDAVQDTIRELRELAHGIYPPLLVDSGLGEALRAVAGRSPLDVELSAGDIGRYPADVEAAIYFCCLEALQNASKHAADAHVVVRVWEESGGLLFEVADDGPGFDVQLAKRGQGFVNMMDRLGAIGGSVRWESRPGDGTTIRGSVPL
ncbi:MAG TPA: histidine kinase [Acidimicrobiales bacterium]